MAGLRRWVTAAFFAGSGLFLVLHGAHLVRDGRLDDTSLEYHRNLFLVNEINALRGRPLQESLTVRQVRVFGWTYVAIDPVCLALAAITAVGVLG